MAGWADPDLPEPLLTPLIQPLERPTCAVCDDPGHRSRTCPELSSGRLLLAAARGGWLADHPDGRCRRPRDPNCLGGCRPGRRPPPSQVIAPAVLTATATAAGVLTWTGTMDGAGLAAFCGMLAAILWSTVLAQAWWLDRQLPERKEP